MDPEARAAAAAQAAREAEAAAAKARAAAAQAQKEAAAARKTAQPDTEWEGGGGGCFGRGSSVLVATDNGFIQKDVFDVKAGDQIAVSNCKVTTGPATAQVACVVQIDEPAGSTICMLPGGLHITASHPICIDGIWQLPKHHRDATMITNLDRSVVNFVLSVDARCWDHGQSVLVNGIACAAWGHGLTDEHVAHKFFGTSAVVKSIAKADAAGFESGHVNLSGFVHDADDHFALAPAPLVNEQL